MSRRSVAGSIVAALVLTLTQVLGVVNAAAASQNVNLNFSGSAPARQLVSVDGGFGTLFSASAAVSAGADWQASDQIAVAYTDDNLRQGSNLDLGDTLTPGAGTVAVHYRVTGNLSADNFDQSVTDSFPCAMPLPGDVASSCSSSTSIPLDSITVASSGFFSLQVQLSLEVATAISAGGSSRDSNRTASIAGGGAIADAPLSFVGAAPAHLADPMALAPIACTQPVGSHLLYSLTSNRATGTLTMVTTVDLVAAIVASPLIGPNFTFFSGQISPSISGDPVAYTVAMTAPDQGTDLGAILPDQTPPVVSAGGPYGAVEGSAIAFDGSGSSDKCGPPTLAWTFGDGSSASGAQPAHTYTEEGTYTAGLTATNVTGLSSSTSFPITVSDAALSGLGRTLITAQAFSGTVASFTDADSAGTVADYSASINWGDGTSGPGTVSALGSGFAVTGSHGFASTALGPQTITINVCDAGGSCVTVNSQALVFTYTTGGSFVIGDSSAGVLTPGAIGTGSAVTFWGAQWAKANVVSGGGAPSAFKGFANSPATPACGTAWSSDPGNSPPPAASLPAYTAMIVASSVTKVGQQVRGSDVHVVIVRTNAGYAPNPGTPGTGVIVGVLC